MKKSIQGTWSSAAMLGLMVAGAIPAAAGPVYRPMLLGYGGAPFCGPCMPGPTLTGGAPNSSVIALRYRWSAQMRRFEPISKQEVGITNEKGELPFTVEQGPGSLDKLVVYVAGQFSEPFVFQTVEFCSPPVLCPGPFEYHSTANASAYLAGQAVVVTVTGGRRGAPLEIVQQEYVEDGDRQFWIPTGDGVRAEVDPLGHATVILTAPGPGVYRAVARDPETGAESSASPYEVGNPPRPR